MERQIPTNPPIAELCRLLRTDIPDELKPALASKDRSNTKFLRIEASLCCSADDSEPFDGTERVLLVSTEAHFHAASWILITDYKEGLYQP